MGNWESRPDATVGAASFQLEPELKGGKKSTQTFVLQIPLLWKSTFQVLSDLKRQPKS